MREKGGKINQTQRREFSERTVGRVTIIERQCTMRAAFSCARPFDPASSEIRIFVGSQFQCKSVHEAPLCLANGTMNPQKAGHVKFCSSSTAHRGHDAQWSTRVEDRRDGDSRATSVIDSEERKEGTAGGVARNQAVVSDSVTRLITRLNREPRLAATVDSCNAHHRPSLFSPLAVPSLPSF